ncbi:MAG: SUMF1/EgtB/PvdO family nonheme iron enzyme [Thermodesulfobacteriota bacterium]
MKRKSCYRTTLVILLLLITSTLLCPSIVGAESPFEIEKREYITAIARHRMNGEWAKALEYFDKLADLNIPLSANFAFYRGETEYNLKRYGDAQKKLTAYIWKYGERGLKYSEAWAILLEIAEVYAGEGRHEEARSIITEYIAEVGAAGSHYEGTMLLLNAIDDKEREAEAATELNLESTTEAAERAERDRQMIGREIRDKMILVEGGCFYLNKSIEDDGNRDDRRRHETCVDSYYIGTYEVTQKEWSAVMGNNPSYFKGCETCPVGGLSWNDTQTFIIKLNDITGLKFRLPTEAEWVYAARGGGKEENESATKSDVDISSVAWGEDSSYKRTYPVGQKRPNALGLYDMNGNAWEWVEDWYREPYYVMNAPRRNPRGPSTGVKKILRGGSWDFVPRGQRAASRYTYVPDGRYGSFGLRLALPTQE